MSMKKKQYQRPSMQTLALRQRFHLLAGSDVVHRTSGEDLQYGGAGNYDDR